MKHVFKLVLALFLLSGISANAQGNKKEIASVLYMNELANYGFRIVEDGKTLMEQEEIRDKNSGVIIHFNRSDADKAASHVLSQIRKGLKPESIDLKTWNLINE